VQQSTVGDLLERGRVDLNEMVAVLQSVGPESGFFLFLPALDVPHDAIAVASDKVFNTSLYPSHG